MRISDWSSDVCSSDLAAAIRLYDRFTHEGLDRRAFMAELTRISGSAAAANALLLGIAASPAAAAIVPENDDRLIIRRGSLGLKGRALNGYVATPKAPAGTEIPCVPVTPENPGLNPHLQQLAPPVAL